MLMREWTSIYRNLPVVSYHFPTPFAHGHNARRIDLDMDFVRFDSAIHGFEHCSQLLVLQIKSQ